MLFHFLHAHTICHTNNHFLHQQKIPLTSPIAFFFLSTMHTKTKHIPPPLFPHHNCFTFTSMQFPPSMITLPYFPTKALSYCFTICFNSNTPIFGSKKFYRFFLSDHTYIAKGEALVRIDRAPNTTVLSDRTQKHLFPFLNFAL